MSYENKEIIKDALLDSINDVRILDEASSELDHVYTRAFKADELKTINGIILGEMDTLKINLNYYKKQAEKADEYEAKAKAFDAIREAHKPLEHRMSPVTVDEGLDFAEKTENIILEYESGG